jgi:hypothetical protein
MQVSRSSLKQSFFMKVATVNTMETNTRRIGTVCSKCTGTHNVMQHHYNFICSFFKELLQLRDHTVTINIKISDANSMN